MQVGDVEKRGESRPCDVGWQRRTPVEDRQEEGGEKTKEETKNESPKSKTRGRWGGGKGWTSAGEDRTGRKGSQKRRTLAGLDAFLDKPSGSEATRFRLRLGQACWTRCCGRRARASSGPAVWFQRVFSGVLVGFRRAFSSFQGASSELQGVCADRPPGFLAALLFRRGRGQSCGCSQWQCPVSATVGQVPSETVCSAVVGRRLACQTPKPEGTAEEAPERRRTAFLRNTRAGRRANRTTGRRASMPWRCRRPSPHR